MAEEWRGNSSHWGAFQAAPDPAGGLRVRAHPLDPEPTPLLGNIASSAHHRARVAGPAVRAGWLDRGPGPDPARGKEPFVAVSWDTLNELLSRELVRIYTTHGPEAVYGGSYGWASAGRFHHAQSQVHRFLNLLGGFVRSVNTYSLGASAVILPHVLGMPAFEVTQRSTTWQSVLENASMIVAFGGMAVKNASVSPGGVTRHEVAGRLRSAGERGIEMHVFSPIRDELPAGVPFKWYPIRPGTDTAVMLGLAHTLLSEGLHDRGFLATHCSGFDVFERYLRGTDDGQEKTADWAASLSDLDAGELRRLARSMARGRTLIQTSWSLQRAEHGEQPIWAAVTLAAMLGQIGVAGAGFGHGYGSMAEVGATALTHRLPSFPQGKNPVATYIPVARAADMLLAPGEPYEFNGQQLRYPDIRMVYWCGGNPFHHHQDLNRLRQAWTRPETIVVHDPYWTASARHADIVVPSTITLERNDIGASHNDAFVHAMKRCLEPYASARGDFDVFADLTAAISGDRGAFTEGLDEMRWLARLYAELREFAPVWLPAFEEFWERGTVELPTSSQDAVLLGSFRADPAGHPLRTPSRKIEIFSSTIAGFGYEDCPGHATWIPPTEWLGGVDAERFPLHLIANQPRARLHSQLDMGDHSQATKIAGREPLRMNPADARERGLEDGDVVRVFNDRGACLAGLSVSETIRPRVVQLSTGAWYDPEDPLNDRYTCIHGNPNVLTTDRGTSRLSQATTGQHALVQVARFDGPPPPVKAFDPPVLLASDPIAADGHPDI